jgi:ATP-dependent RNA helicase DeaD
MKFSLLVHLLKEEKSELVMVFCNTRRNTDFVVDNLNRLGINSKAIHGGLEQKKRLRVLKEFHGKDVHVLVCTDVAARGLDIKNVSHVYNYDLPKQSADYIHRIGRTARAGKEGKAVSILSSRDYENFGTILQDESIKILQEKLPYIKRVSINIPQTKERSFGREGQRSGYRGASRDAPRRSSSSRDGPKRYSGGRDGARRSGSSRDGPRRYSSSRDSPRRSESNRDGPRKYSDSKDSPRRSGGSRDSPRRSPSSRDAPRRGSREGQRKYSKDNRSKR